VKDQCFVDKQSGIFAKGEVITREERNRDLIISIGPWKVVDHRSDVRGVQRTRKFGYRRKGDEQSFDSGNTKSRDAKS